MAQLAPYIETAALFAEILTDFTTYTSQIPANAMHISLPAAAHKSVRMALEEGAVVRVYTVNDIDYVKTLQQLGVQAVFTDDPEKITDALRG